MEDVYVDSEEGTIEREDCRETTQMDWISMDQDWISMDWTLMDWTLMDWTLMDWISMNWLSMGWIWEDDIPWIHSEGVIACG